MAEYIKREAVKRLVNNNFSGLLAAIDSIPAADVALVVHGRWSDAGFGELPKHAPYGWACSA